MNFKSPCLGCADRYVGCHSTCQKYAEAKEQYEKEKEEANQQEQARIVVDCYRCRRAAKNKAIRLQQYKKRK